VKLLRILVSVIVLGAALPGVPLARADVTVSINLFHDQLAPYGRWIDDSRFGEVWVPRHGRGWRPYSNGHWVYTDEYGWLWVEQDEWGWATEHYGRWFFDDAIGWLWIPGTQWAPAWVVWRSTPEYVGWAPLAPYGYRYRHYENRRWSFVDCERFLAPNVRSVIYDPSHNHDFLRRVPWRGKVYQSRGRWVNRAIRPAVVERASHERVRPVRVHDLDRAERARVGAETVSVFRPKVEARDEAARVRASKQRARAAEQQDRARKAEERRRAAIEERQRARELEQQRTPSVEKQPRTPSVEKQPRAPRVEKQQRAPSARQQAPRGRGGERPVKVEQRTRATAPAPRANEVERGHAAPRVTEPRHAPRTPAKAQPQQRNAPRQAREQDQPGGTAATGRPEQDQAPDPGNAKAKGKGGRR